MTRLRKLATKISCLVVRAASPAAKDWARASSSEMEFIESNWAALRWALGSAKVLCRLPDEAPLTALSSVPMAAEKLVRQTARRALLVAIVAVVEVVFFARSLVHAHNLVQRIGCYLIIAAMLYIASQVIARRGRALPPDATLGEQTAHYGAELEAERRFHSGSRLWSRALFAYGAIATLEIGGLHIGRHLSRPPLSSRSAFTALMLLALIFVSIAGNMRGAAKFQRRIEELDTLKNSEA